MDSEQIRILSEDVSDNSSEHSEGGEWVPKAVAAFRLKCSEKTIEKRMSEGILTGRIRNGRREIFLKNRKSHLSDSECDSERNFFGSESSEVGFGLKSEASEPVPNTSEPVVRMDSEQVIIELRQQLDELRTALEQERIKAARLEAKMENLDQLLASKDQIILTQEKAMHSHEMALEMAQNERITITNQLQKYRSKDEQQPRSASQKEGKWKWPWEK